jgi:hypothetical protein
MHPRLQLATLAAATLFVPSLALAQPVPNAAPSLPPPDAPDDDGEETDQPKQPKRGDFDAGGQVRLPSGPDEMGQYATFNWVALDLKGRYFVLDSLTVNGTMPMAIIKPDTAMGVEPSMFGGFAVGLDARVPNAFMPDRYKADVGVMFTAAYMREGAMLLSEKDFPLFTGDFQPGLSTGFRTKLQLSSLVDFSLTPLFVFQKGTTENLTAVQIPMSTILRLGSAVAVSADLGVYTGDDFSFRGSNGGRISAGGSLTIKIGPILAHAGAGVASLLTGPYYPSVTDSVYIDLNVKYAK